MGFDQVAVEARRRGVPSSETADLLLVENANATVGEVVHAFALAGYPAFDNLLGTRTYFIVKMGFHDPEIDGMIMEKLRDVKYPENEIQEAFTRVVG